MVSADEIKIASRGKVDRKEQRKQQRANLERALAPKRKDLESNIRKDLGKDASDEEVEAVVEREFQQLIDDAMDAIEPSPEREWTLLRVLWEALTWIVAVGCALFAWWGLNHVDELAQVLAGNGNLRVTVLGRKYELGWAEKPQPFHDYFG
ncbi:unnamed protein product [Pedinophyceae sp. YPF-701]|nr:unnamed protein product [Pedinophyceae sp. YPF-701]